MQKIYTEFSTLMDLESPWNKASKFYATLMLRKKGIWILRIFRKSSKQALILSKSLMSHCIEECMMSSLVGKTL